MFPSWYHYWRIKYPRLKDLSLVVAVPTICSSHSQIHPRTMEGQWFNFIQFLRNRQVIIHCVVWSCDLYGCIKEQWVPVGVVASKDMQDIATDDDKGGNYCFNITKLSPGSSYTFAITCKNDAGVSLLYRNFNTSICAHFYWACLIVHLH